MTPEEAAWVREHVWTERMRAAEEKYPGTWTRCPCQWEACHQCKRGVHDDCIGVPRQHDEGMIANKTGVQPACFPRQDKHGTIDGAPKAPVVAQVWLADRICTSECRCGCRGKRPMSPAEASWVRTHAWTPAMRREYRDDMACACQYGPSTWCLQGSCGRCRPADPIAIWETTICDRTGIHPTRLPQEYEHETVSATGPHRERLAMVWLAGRMCKWRCPCACHSEPGLVQDALFDLSTSM